MAQRGRVLPLHKRGNRLYVATSDPANSRRWKRSASRRISSSSRSSSRTTSSRRRSTSWSRRPGRCSRKWRRWRISRSTSRTPDAAAGQRRRGKLRSRGRAGRQVHPEDPDRRDQRRASPTSTSSRTRSIYRIRYRLDGMLLEVAQPPLVIKDKIASRIKVISKLDISEKRVPQDGRMKLVLSKSKAIDFRVSTLPTLFGEKIVMRILDSSGVKLGIEALGYEPDQQEPLMYAIGRPYGMILVTGPDRQRQDGVALHLPQHPEPAGHQHLDRRGSGGNPAARRQPGQHQRKGGAHVRRRRCGRSCGRTRTSSWSAKSATSRPPTSRSRRRRRATSCSRRCTRTTRRRR